MQADMIIHITKVYQKKTYQNIKKFFIMYSPTDVSASAYRISLHFRVFITFTIFAFTPSQSRKVANQHSASNLKT